MSVYHSQFRGEIANFPGGKVDGGDYPGDLVNKTYPADHEFWRPASGRGHRHR